MERLCRGEWNQRAGLLASLQLNEPKEEAGGAEGSRPGGGRSEEGEAHSVASSC